MPTPPRVTDQVRQAIADLHGQGKGRNAIARELELSGDTVTKVCKDLGLTFDTKASEAAVAAHKAQAAEQRARIEAKLLTAAERMIDRTGEQHTYLDHGGKDFVKVEWTQDEPTAADQKHYMSAAGIALDKANRLAELHRETEVDAAQSMLVQLFENMAEAARKVEPRSAEA